MLYIGPWLEYELAQCFQGLPPSTQTDRGVFPHDGANAVSSESILSCYPDLSIDRFIHQTPRKRQGGRWQRLPLNNARRKDKKRVELKNEEKRGSTLPKFNKTRLSQIQRMKQLYNQGRKMDSTKPRSENVKETSSLTSSDTLSGHQNKQPASSFEDLLAWAGQLDAELIK